MFRHTFKNMPKDPHYPADLEKLGFEINELGQFVKTGKPTDFYNFYHTNNERANDVRKEAMHACARKEIIGGLGDLGVKEIFVHGKEFDSEKPAGPHVSMLATDMGKLKDKKDVIVVVGEHNQDLGVWAYRLLMREPGTDGGSVVGMMRKLQNWGRDEDTSVQSAEQAIEKLKLDGVADGPRKATEVPGIIILNPGELIYSHKLNRSMSQPAWLARPKKSAVDENFKIDLVHNRVPGHETPEAHVRTVLEHVIPKITQQDVRLYFVGLSNGSESVLNYLDDKFLENCDEHITSGLEAIALIQPTHVPAQLQSVKLVNTLATASARSFVSSEKPKGELLAMLMPQVSAFSLTDGIASQQLQRIVGSVDTGNVGGADRDSSGSETSTSTALPIPGAGKRTRSVEPSIMGSANSNQSLASKISDSYDLLDSASAIQASMQSLPSEVGSVEKSGSLGTRSRATTMDSKMQADTDALTDPNMLTDSNDSLAIAKMHESQVSDGYEPYAYHKDPVSCPTFSAGIEDVTELIWPAVMDNVLEWFRDLKEYANERDARMVESQEEKALGRN